jgi:hypothetical protein
VNHIRDQSDQTRWALTEFLVQGWFTVSGKFKFKSCVTSRNNTG